MKSKKPECRWPTAHIALKRLYEERVPAGMTQEQFGAEFGIGTQAMVWQYLNGWRPVNIEAAAKFAQGLRCTIRDISPEMADALEAEILPMLGTKALKRAAAKVAVLVGAALFTLPPSSAEAAFDINKIVSTFLRQAIELNTHWKLLVRTLAAMFGIIRAAVVVPRTCPRIPLSWPQPS